MGLFLILFIFIAALLTSFISGMVGMAGDMLLLVILAIKLLPAQQTMILYTSSMFFACASRAFIHRRHLHFKSIEYYMVGLLFFFIFGSLPGVAVESLSQDLLQAAGYILLGVAFFVPFFTMNKIKLDFSQPQQALACAVVTGIFTHIDDSGFLLNLFFQDIPMTRYQVIATKAVAQLIPYGIVLGHAGLSTFAAPDLPPELIWVCLALAPITFAGSYLATFVLRRLNDFQFYKITQIILWIMGAIYVAKGAFLLKSTINPLPAAPKP